MLPAPAQQLSPLAAPLWQLAGNCPQSVETGISSEVNILGEEGIWVTTVLLKTEGFFLVFLQPERSGGLTRQQWLSKSSRVSNRQGWNCSTLATLNRAESRERYRKRRCSEVNLKPRNSCKVATNTSDVQREQLTFSSNEKDSWVCST